MPITSISASIINGLKKLATNLVYAYHPPITKPSSINSITYTSLPLFATPTTSTTPTNISGIGTSLGMLLSKSVPLFTFFPVGGYLVLLYKSKAIPLFSYLLSEFPTQ